MANTEAPVADVFLPMAQYKGEVFVVKPGEWSLALSNWLEHQYVLGFSADWDAEHEKGQDNPITWVQISSMDRALLIQVDHQCSLPQDLCTFFQDPDKLKVCVSQMGNEQRKFESTFGFAIEGVVSLQQEAVCRGFPSSGLKKLSHNVLGQTMRKNVKYSRLVKEGKLKDENEGSEKALFHLQHVAEDAYFNLKLYFILRDLPADAASIGKQPQELGVTKTESVDPDVLARIEAKRDKKKRKRQTSMEKRLSAESNGDVDPEALMAQLEKKRKKNQRKRRQLEKRQHPDGLNQGGLVKIEATNQGHPIPRTGPLPSRTPEEKKAKLKELKKKKEQRRKERKLSMQNGGMQNAGMMAPQAVRIPNQVVVKKTQNKRGGAGRGLGARMARPQGGSMPPLTF